MFIERLKCGVELAVALSCYGNEVDCGVDWTVRPTVKEIPTEKGKFKLLNSKLKALVKGTF